MKVNHKNGNHIEKLTEFSSKESISMEVGCRGRLVQSRFETGDGDGVKLRLVAVFRTLAETASGAGRADVVGVLESIRWGL